LDWSLVLCSSLPSSFMDLLYTQMSSDSQSNSGTAINGATSAPNTTSKAATPDLDFKYDDDEDEDHETEAEIVGYGSNGETTLTTPPPASTYHYNDDASSALPITRSTVIFSLCAALNSANLGYDVGVSSVAGPLLQDSDMALSDVQLELFIGSLNLFAMVGAFFASTISDKFGRRRSFIVAAVGFVIGVLIMATAPNYGMLMFGRVFVGLGVGFGLAIDPLYISEIAPAPHRGRLVTWSEIAINVGIVFGFSTGLFFTNVDPDVAWRTMFGLGGILPICLIFLVIFVMPESPRWLISRGQVDEARQILQEIYPPSYNVEKVINEIQDTLRREAEMEHSEGWNAILFPSPAVKRMLFVGLGTAFAQQIVGIDAIQYFLLNIIEEAGIEDKTTQIVILINLGILKLTILVWAGKQFDKRGRRQMFFISLSGMIIALVLIAISFFVGENKASYLGIVGLALYLSFFSVGMGPGSWLIPAEVFSLGIRAKAMSIATFLNRTTATIISSSFLSLADSISYGGFFILLAVFCLIVLLFFYRYLPETKGKSLEEMAVYFAEISGDEKFLEAERKIQESAPPRVSNQPDREVGVIT